MARKKSLFIYGQLAIYIQLSFISLIKCIDNNDNNDNTKVTTNAEPPNVATNAWENIDGCPDYASFNTTLTAETELTKITCICGPSDVLDQDVLAKSISINCIYGSTLADFSRTLKAVVRANKTVDKISLSGILVDENNTQSLSSVLQNVYATTEIPIRTIHIKTCHGGIPPLISESNITDELKLKKLEYLTIEYCELEEIPKSLIKSSSKLKEMSLSNNKIQQIRTNDMAAASKSLKYLNMESNLLNNVEDGALRLLENLKTLRIGEHNFANSALLNEIERIPQLENLDMTRMDGIDDLKSFSSKSMKLLTLTGCNFKNISQHNFEKLASLEQLDLRVNLIEQINPKAFVGLNKLLRLNLAGNFLRHINYSDGWNGLTSIKHIDLGWNDFTKLNSTTFQSLNDEIEVIDLRHNEKLKSIEAGTFTHFKKLVFLNLSHSALSHISDEIFTSPQMKILDLSYSNISTIDEKAFDRIKNSLEYLNISSNHLTGIPENILKEMPKLKELDLSGNPWICDISMKKVRDIINHMYKLAAANSMDFELRNEKNTICHRPYGKKGVSIFQLEDDEFNYDKSLDVTEAPTSTTTTSSNETEEFTQINWQQVTIRVSEDENTLGTMDEDMGKPTYDINSIKYGQRTYKKLSNTWLSAVIVVILILLTAVCIILIVRRKKTKMVKNDISCTATSTQL